MLNPINSKVKPILNYKEEKIAREGSLGIMQNLE